MSSMPTTFLLRLLKWIRPPSMTSSHAMYPTQHVWLIRTHTTLWLEKQEEHTLRTPPNNKALPL